MSEETASFLSRGIFWVIFPDFVISFIKTFGTLCRSFLSFDDFFGTGLLKMHSTSPEEVFKQTKMIWEKSFLSTFCRSLGEKSIIFYKRLACFLKIDSRYPEPFSVEKICLFSFYSLISDFQQKWDFRKHNQIVCENFIVPVHKSFVRKKTYFLKIFTESFFRVLGGKKGLAKRVSAWLQKLHSTCPVELFKWIHEFSRKIVFFKIVFGLRPKKNGFLERKSTVL